MKRFLATVAVVGALTCASALAIQDPLRDLANNVLSQARDYEVLSLDPSNAQAALEAQLVLRQDISSFIAFKSIVQKPDAKIEANLIQDLGEQLDDAHFAGLVKAGHSGLIEPSQQVSDFLKSVCNRLPKDRQKSLKSSQGIECKKI
jgi:hypothetical protein